MSIDFDWVRVSSVFGPLYKPVANVEFETNAHEWQSFELKVDSGAVVTLLNADDCSLLGYKLNDGEEKKLKVANNGEVIVRIHKIRMKIGDITLPNEVRVAFAEHQVPELLLGRLDVFNHFEIHLKQDQLKTTMISKIRSVTPRPN